MSEGTIQMKVNFTGGLPPHENILVFKRLVADRLVTAVMDKAGRIVVVITDRWDKLIAQETFDPFRLRIGTSVTLAVSWVDKSIECYVGSQRLRSDDVRKSSPVLLDGIAARNQPIELIYPRLNFHSSYSPLEQLFIGTLRELDERLIEKSWYSLLRSAALLRQLLLDDLINDVNRNYRCKLRFEVFSTGEKPPNQPQLALISIDPEQHPNRVYRKLTIDAFLSTIVVEPGISVKQIIHTCANVKGGVHFGPTKEDFQKRVTDVDTTLRVGSLEPSLVVLRDVGVVTLRALLPLIDAISVAHSNAPSRASTFEGKPPYYRVTVASKHSAGQRHEKSR